MRKKDSLCATVKFQYPEFKSVSFNQVIKKEILNIYHDDNDSTKSRSTNFEELAKPFVDDYDLKLKEGKEYVKGANTINEGGFLAMPWYFWQCLGIWKLILLCNVKPKNI